MFQVILINSFINKPNNHQTLYVRKLQKSIESQKYKLWKRRRKEFRKTILDIKEPIPKNLEDEKALSSRLAYEENLKKVSNYLII